MTDQSHYKQIHKSVKRQRSLEHGFLKVFVTVSFIREFTRILKRFVETSCPQSMA